jgi:putative Holliday junction resolvase
VKIVGIDYGTKRVGVAVSDEGGTVAFPRMTLANDRMLMTALKEFIEKEHAEEIVLGESKGRDGTDNPVMKDARFFAGELERMTGLTVRYEPEFYTSVEARRLATEAGNVNPKLVDAEAAAVILNSYLEHHGSHHR